MRAQDTHIIDAISRSVRPGAVRSTAVAIFALAIGMLAMLSGCSAAQRGDISIAGDARGPSTSQPANQRIDADQLVGTIAAKIAPYIESAVDLAMTTTVAPVLNASANAAIEARIRADVRAEFTAQGLGNYTSQYPIGAVLSVLGATIGTLIVMSLALQRSLATNHFAMETLGRFGEQSHARQLARISVKAAEEMPPDESSVPPKAASRPA